MTSSSSTTREINSVEEAVKLFLRLGPRNNDTLVFRGHGDYDWRLKAAIARADNKLRMRECDLVRELVAVAPNEFSRDVTMFDRLVRMQHFGLPTRLMDVSSNPFVALYFASDSDIKADGAFISLRVPTEDHKYFDSDTVSCIANLANLSGEERELIRSTTARGITAFNKISAVDRLVQFVRAEKPAFRAKIVRGDLFRRILVTPKMNNRRIIAQSGSFIIFGLSKEAEQTINIKVQRYRIKYAKKEAIRRELEMLGFTKSSLYPELDSAASQTVQKFLNAPAI